MRKIIVATNFQDNWISFSLSKKRKRKGLSKKKYKREKKTVSIYKRRYKEKINGGSFYIK